MFNNKSTYHKSEVVITIKFAQEIIFLGKTEKLL